MTNPGTFAVVSPTNLLWPKVQISLERCSFNIISKFFSVYITFYGRFHVQIMAINYIMESRSVKITTLYSLWYFTVI